MLIGAKARQEIVIENKEDLPFAFAFDKVMDANLDGLFSKDTCHFFGVAVPHQ